MIKTIYQFGEQLQKMEDMKPFFRPCDAVYSENDPREQKVIFIEIRKRQFTGLVIEDYKSALDSMYLYRDYAPNGTGIMPSLNFYNLTDRKEYNEKIKSFLKKLEKSLNNSVSVFEKHFDVSKVFDAVSKELENAFWARLPQKQNYLLTLRIDDKLMGEFPELVAILESKAYNKYFLDSNDNEYRAFNKTCAVTYKPVDEVWGWVDTLGFTLEKETFSRNGFNVRDSYKMFPVSPEAVKVMEGTRKVLDTALSFPFQGTVRFFVLPRFVALNSDILRGNLTKQFYKLCRRSNKPQSTETRVKALVNSENTFSEIIEDKELNNSSVYYDIFFYEQKQAQFSIKLHVSDVMPSRFTDIMSAKETLENYFDPITRITSKKDIFHFKLTFYEIRRFFPEPFFYKIIEAIFYKQPISEKLVLDAFMQLLISDFKNRFDDKRQYDFARNAKRSFCIHLYFQTLQLFGKMDNNIGQNAPLSMSAENFVGNHHFFDNNLKKAAFYLGCATEMLLSAQRSNLVGNEPFALKLHNLNVGFKELVEIFPKLMNKAQEYRRADKFYDGAYFDQLLTLVGQLLMDDKNTSKTETAYAFSLGLVMEKEFRNKRIEKREADKKAKAELEKQQKQAQQ